MVARGTSTSGSGGRCDPGRAVDRLLKPRTAASIVLGLVLLVAGVVVAPGALPIGPLLLSLGALVLLLAVTAPALSAINLNLPLVAQATFNADARRHYAGTVSRARTLDSQRRLFYCDRRWWFRINAVARCAPARPDGSIQ